MRKRTAFMLMMPLIAALSSCSVKEERIDCPCWLSVNLEKTRQRHPDISQKDVSIAMWSDDLIRREKVETGRYREYPYYQRKVPRGMVMLSTYSGQEKMTVRGSALLIDRGRQCDSIYAYSNSVDCSAEHAMDTPVLHKQFATVYIRMSCNEEDLFSFGVRFRGNVNGFDTIDMTPLSGEFEFRAFGEGRQGNIFSARIPRQRDDSLQMEILSGDDIDDTVDIGRIIADSGYSWDDDDLDDIMLDIEHAGIVVNLQIIPWQDDFRVLDLDDDAVRPEIVLSIRENEHFHTKSADDSRQTMSVSVPETSGILVDYVPITGGTQTKASAIAGLEDVPSLYWSGTSGPWKDETPKWNSVQTGPAGDSLHTGRYQSNPATRYNYYVSNVPISFSSGGSTIEVDGSTDVIAGCTKGATDDISPSITLEHILARTGKICIIPPEGCTINPVSYVLFADRTGGPKGTYNIATRDWSNIPDRLTAYTLKDNSDLYLIPGTYLIRIGIYLRKGKWEKGYVKEGHITLKAGHVNNITVNAQSEYHAEMARTEFSFENNYQHGNGNSYDYYGHDQIMVTCNGTDVTSECRFDVMDSHWFEISRDGRITCPVSGSMVPDSGHGAYSTERHRSKADVTYMDPGGRSWRWTVDLQVTLTNEDETSI